ncbi:aspartic peptidase domain-containing protein [Mycena olivaceomarginata]|nr:aspartic peptidase domain-containing protein [Mycena olivaceomarginata]
MLVHLVHIVLRLCAILCIVSSAPRSVAEPLHVPLLRSSGRSPIPRDHFAPAQGTGSYRDRRQLDFFAFTSPYYFAEISIGTPAQKFKMMVDTSISSSIVWGKACSGCSSLGGSYDATASSTFANKSTTSTNFPYRDGNVEGYIFADTIKVGPLSVAKGEFLQVTEITAELPDPVSGSLGLAFGGTKETTATPFWQALIAAGGTSTPEMGFWLSRALATDNVQGEQESVGVLTFGGVNSSLYSGDIEFLGLAAGSAALGSWMLEISAINVGNKAIGVTPNETLAMFDTTLGSIYGPEADVKAIYAAIGSASSQLDDGDYQIPCNTNVTVSVSFGGQTWSIDGKDIIQEPVSGNTSMCFGAIQGRGGSDSPSWTFGIPFLRNVYSVFRAKPPLIGFAQLSTVAGGTGTPNASISTAGSSSSASSPSSTTFSNPDSTLSPGATKTKSNTAAIAGGVSAGVIVLLVILSGVLFYRWRRRKRTDPVDYTVSAFHNDVEAPPPSAVTVMAESSRSAALVSMKRAQIAAVGNYREASNNLVQTPKGLQLSPGPVSYLGDSSLEGSSAPSSSQGLPTSSPESPPSDPAILQELQTLRHEVRWLATQRTGDEPPPIYM